MSDPELDAALAQAETLRIAGEFDAAREAYERAAAGWPQSAKAAQHLGALLAQLGCNEAAVAPLRRALALAPGDAATRHSLGSALKAIGRFAEGWSYADARFELPALNNPRRDLPFPQWRSFHVAGRHVVIFPEQGYGDQIQMARFVATLVERGARVTLLAPPALLRLFADSFPQATVLEMRVPVEFARPDFWLPATDLPGLVDATPESLPGTPYLRTDRRWPAPPAGPTIGLATRGRPDYWQDARRSLSPGVASRLRAALPGSIVSLHPEDSGARDFAETAALMGELDAIVSVDTSVAHLAGALAKPCFTLIPGFGTDWRWMQDRVDTPWYPTMRLYRSTVDGDWTAAIDRLAADVHALIGRAR